MTKVRCTLCEFESDGLCTKKTRGGSPIAVKVNKPRNCPKYSEDALRILSQYRKGEAHKAVLRRQVLSRARVAQKIEELRAAGITELVSGRMESNK